MKKDKQKQHLYLTKQTYLPWVPQTPSFTTTTRWALTLHTIRQLIISIWIFKNSLKRKMQETEKSYPLCFNRGELNVGWKFTLLFSFDPLTLQFGAVTLGRLQMCYLNPQMNTADIFTSHLHSSSISDDTSVRLAPNSSSRMWRSRLALNLLWSVYEIFLTKTSISPLNSTDDSSISKWASVENQSWV